MNRRTLAATVTAAALAAALAACESTPASTSHAPSASHTGVTAAPACTVQFGPNQAGIYATGHKIDAGITFTCNGTETNSFISLTLAYVPPGTSPADDQEAPDTTYRNPNPSSYTASAPCQAGGYALHDLYDATVNGTTVSGETWGKAAAVTAADCARS